MNFVFVRATFGELLERTADGLESGSIGVEAGPYDSALVYRTSAGRPRSRERYFGGG